MRKKIFTLLLLMLTLPSSLRAYDFIVGGLCYNYTNGSSGSTVHVTYQNNLLPRYTNLSGAITIPPTVTFNGKTYSVTSIGICAFSGCTGLTSVTIPNSVTSIGRSAFYGCTGLTSVTIPNSVTSIGICAFQNCTGLTSVTIGNSVTEIGLYTFAGCSGLTSVTIPNSVTTIGGEAFWCCTGLTSVNIGNSVTSIGDDAFRNCSGLTSVTIPNSVTYIGSYAFSDCTGLTSVTIGNSVTEIGYHAFSGCSGLTSVTIGNSVTSIGWSAFQNCTGLTSVISLIENPNNVVLGQDCFYGIPDDCLLYVLNSSYSYYFYANVWKDFNIVLLDDIKPNIEKLNHVRGERFVKVTIPFNMNNYDDISGFQFDITLPEGMSIATDGDGVSSVWLNSERKARNHSIGVSQLFENTYRVLASSPTNNKFKGNDGVVMYLELEFSREHPIGNYNVYIDNIELVAPDETKYRGLGTSIAVDYWYLLGDADCDARVDVADYTVTALHILNRPVDVFYSDAANVNGDNQISVTDLAGIVNIALGIRDHEYYQAPSVSHCSDQTAPATPSLKASLEGDNVVMFGLDNDIPLAGLQLDIQLPQGMTVTEASLEGRAAKYQLSTSTLPDGIVRVLISSFSDEDIETGDDTVLKLVLDGNNENGDMLYMTGAQAVSRNLTTYYIEDISLPIATTSISLVNNGAENLKVYGLGNNIVVDSPCDMHIQVVNVNGMVMPVEVKEGHNIIEIGGHGVYIIRVGNSAYKVRL